VFLAAIAVVVLALTAFTDDDADVPTQGFHPEAVAHERDAHLEGQARTHAGAPSTESSGDEVLPGSRRVPSS
jgi:hypothetical protein